jgi:uncharacterized protein YbaR (Trm112 family)
VRQRVFPFHGLPLRNPLPPGLAKRRISGDVVRIGELPMIQREILSILVCPEDHSPLSLAEPEMLARLNRAIAAGKDRNRAGRAVEQPLQAGLGRADNSLLYPIPDDIPVLLIDEAIALGQCEQ